MISFPDSGSLARLRMTAAASKNVPAPSGLLTLVCPRRFTFASPVRVAASIQSTERSRRDQRGWRYLKLRSLYSRWSSPVDSADRKSDWRGLSVAAEGDSQSGRVIPSLLRGPNCDSTNTARRPARIIDRLCPNDASRWPVPRRCCGEHRRFRGELCTKQRSGPRHRFKRCSGRAII